MVFKKVDDFISYLEFVKAGTKTEVQAYLASIHFTSNRASRGSSLARSTTNNSDEDLNYILDENNMVQIENVLLRLTDDEQFMLTMLDASLTNASYTELVNGIYNSNLMDKFATFGDGNGQLLIPFVNGNPNGYEEGDANGLAGTVFGWGPTTTSEGTGHAFNVPGNCIRTTETCKSRTFYLFGIAIDRDVKCTTKTEIVQSSFCSSTENGYH